MTIYIRRAARNFLTRSLLLCLLGPLVVVPTAVAEESTQELPLRIRNALAHRAVPEESLSAYVQNLSTGETLLSWNSETPRNPASVMKLLTTLVALDVLGPAYTWRTEAYAYGNINGDTLEGDLLLKGYGDPFLVTERVWEMSRRLRRTGLRTVSGDLLIDDSHFLVEDYDPAAFDKQPLRAYNVGPNALMMNFKVVRYFFEPDGNAVRIRLDPELTNLRIDNRLSLQNSSCRGYQRGIAVASSVDSREVTFSGRFPNRCRIYSMARTALSHNEYAYGLFRSMWENVGGKLEGQWRNVTVDVDEEPLLSFESWPLADVISRVNKYSNNVMARHLLFTVGAETYGAPGTAEKGRDAIDEWLKQHALANEVFELSNGSGLSRTARTTARQMAGLLAYAYSQPYMPEFLSSMSVSGLDGTTERRFRSDDVLAGRAHFKTGSLDHVSAIAGYLQARSGDRYAIVTLHNYQDIHRGPGEEVQDAVMRWVYEQ